MKVSRSMSSRKTGSRSIPLVVTWKKPSGSSERRRRAIAPTYARRHHRPPFACLSARIRHTLATKAVAQPATPEGQTLTRDPYETTTRSRRLAGQAADLGRVRDVGDLELPGPHGAVSEHAPEHSLVHLDRPDAGEANRRRPTLGDAVRDEELVARHDEDGAVPAPDSGESMHCGQAEEKRADEPERRGGSDDEDQADDGREHGLPERPHERSRMWPLLQADPLIRLEVAPAHAEEFSARAWKSSFGGHH